MEVLIDGKRYVPEEVDVFEFAGSMKCPPHISSERSMIESVAKATSDTNWHISEMAARWMRTFSRGRSDADFAQMVGLQTDQVYIRRRVYELFGDVRLSLPNLSWTHFRIAVDWDDSADCLSWANETGSTPAEMRAWRRAMRGEDLSSEEDGG